MQVEDQVPDRQEQMADSQTGGFQVHWKNDVEVEAGDEESGPREGPVNEKDADDVSQFEQLHEMPTMGTHKYLKIIRV